MKAPLLPTGPVDAVDSPPQKEMPAPDERNERGDDATPAPAVQCESAFALLCKAWLRCDRGDRLRFLRDVREGSPNLWREAGGDSLEHAQRKAVRK